MVEADPSGRGQFYTSLDRLVFDHKDLINAMAKVTKGYDDVLVAAGLVLVERVVEQFVRASEGLPAMHAQGCICAAFHLAAKLLDDEFYDNATIARGWGLNRDLFDKYEWSVFAALLEAPGNALHLTVDDCRACARRLKGTTALRLEVDRALGEAEGANGPAEAMSPPSTQVFLVRPQETAAAMSAGGGCASVVSVDHVDLSDEWPPPLALPPPAGAACKEVPIVPTVIRGGRTALTNLNVGHLGSRMASAFARAF